MVSDRKQDDRSQVPFMLLLPYYRLPSIYGRYNWLEIVLIQLEVETAHIASARTQK